ncbi:MAG TPA: STAS/SEC14 domain-containing protein [Polyangiaceae bacterium]|jgi:hypothetical protein|nr:STAS/SEC14 domain-containing protein [Polyangiaceae bacterium]
MKSMSFHMVSRIHISAQGREPPTDEDWTAYLQHIKANIRDIDGLIVFTAGGAPTAAQREATSRFWAGEHRRPRIAVLTPSVFVRTIVMAMTWSMGQQIRAFSADDFEGAFSYLAITLVQRVKVQEELLRLRSELLEITSSRAAG